MPEAARRIALTVQAGLTATIALRAVFAWRVFRSESRTGRWLAIGLVGASVAAGGAVLASGTPVPVGALGFGVIAMRRAALLWLFFESVGYARRMRRRVRMGLADPVVANRFVLRALWAGSR